jgi:hypothetical protein
MIAARPVRPVLGRERLGRLDLRIDEPLEPNAGSGVQSRQVEVLRDQPATDDRDSQRGQGLASPA